MMKLILVCIIATAMTTHVLHHFERDITAVKTFYQQGETSKVFSIFMKMLIQTKTLYSQLKIVHPHMANPPAEATCNSMMEQLITLFNQPHWTQIYQQIYQRLHNLQQKCTSSNFIQFKNQNGFDDKCALCTVLSRVMENYVVYHRKDVATFVQNQFCTFFDGLVKPTCQAFVHYAGPHIIRGIINKQNSDVICHASGMCKNAKCKILDQRSEQQFDEAVNSLIDYTLTYTESKPSPWQWLVDIFTKRFGDKHFPPFDLDNDSFSDISTFRGYTWRGADCNQFDAKIYPGRKEGKSNVKDHDCNGIWGRDQKGVSLEDKYCKDYQRYGVAVVGDSAGAHFSIPQKFFNVSMMQKGTFKDLLPRIANELDIPQESAYTGHITTPYETHSIYKYLRKWNMCNNNDFQNLGVNGGDAGNTWGNIHALQRDQNTDHPMMLFLQLIGNDVCGSSVGQRTTPAQFKKNILRLLDYLDTRLPKGSHVFVLGLADGDLLYEYLQGTMHPLNVTFDNVYEFLNCLKISPCAGWLTTNQTARKYTTQLAKNLSKMYQQIIDDGVNYKNFDLVYYEFPTNDMFKRMYLQNRQPKEMIERCDGFHPSVLFNSYLADWLWYKITTEHPSWLGEQNPHNQEIKKIFGMKDLD